MLHYFNTEIANMFGVVPAVVAQNFWYWVRKNERENKNCFDGRFWVYESIREMSNVLYYISHNQVRSAIEKLVKSGILIKGNFNKSHYDRTIWYTFTDEGYAIFVKAEMENGKHTKATG